jgi:FG-GAP-like repeat
MCRCGQVHAAAVSGSIHSFCTAVTFGPKNDAYLGSVVTGRLQPKFVWEPSVVADGEIGYELQYSSDIEFTADVVKIQTSQLSYQPDKALDVSAIPPVGRRYFWRVRACVGDSCSTYSRAWWVNLGRSVKDFNGDGYDDVIVGSHTSLNENGSPGRAFVYLGGSGNAFNAIADATLADQASESWFGYSVGSAGDFNGDGFCRSHSRRTQERLDGN